MKPENVLIGEDGSLKVIDFGLAKIHDVGTTIGNHTQAVGTPFYMAPEVFDSSPSIDENGVMGSNGAKWGYGKSVDIFSYGIIACQMATGKSEPYDNVGRLTQASIHKFLESVRKGRRPSMDGIPPLLKDLIQKCVHKIPKARCSVQEIGDHLELPGLFDPNYKFPPLVRSDSSAIYSRDSSVGSGKSDPSDGERTRSSFSRGLSGMSRGDD